MTDLGRELRLCREAASWSLARMASAIYSSKGHLSKVENGKARVTRQLAAAYDQALNANGVLLAMVDDVPDQRRPRGLVGLPEPTRHFVGRTPELASVAVALGTHQDVRTCVISGLAGVGKTALAVAAAWQAAGDFRDGCLFFDLRGQNESTLTTTEAAHHLLGALEVPRDLVPGDQDGRVNVLRDILRSRQVLLVLDNVRDARQVRPLLPATGRSRVILTSRSRLPSLDDAWHVPLGMLTSQSGQSLFHAVLDGRAEVSDTDAATIVRQCGHLPLAIRIASARIVHGGWDARHLLRRLTDAATKFPALDEGDRSVTAALSVTVDALPPDQRHHLGALSLHPGSTMTVQAAQALTGLTPATTDQLLDQLHEHHLVTRAADGRVQLHDLVHAYVVQYAHPDEENTASVINRLIDHYLAITTDADALVEPQRFRIQHTVSPHSEPVFADDTSALAWLRSTWPTLVRTTELVEDDRCWRLALAARGFFFREKLFDAWISTHERALVTAAGDPAATGMVLNSLGMAHLESGLIEASVEYHQRAREAFAEAGDEAGAIDALSSLAWARLYQGSPSEALSDLTTSLESYRRSGRERNVVIALRGTAFALTALGHHDRARTSATEAYKFSTSPIDMARALSCLAWVAYQANHLAAAGRLSAEAAELTENGYELARALTGLGNVAARKGDDAEAGRLWTAADELASLNPAVVWESSARRYVSGSAV
ncbi:helix-turn-helix domain-containing protein [Actinosynnema sp. NPDC047251]|uniref:Transcriptional regulator n=1 Tax=Saccharothrix espanaensis (strain ATCC 51144 / DSM 44229 / JCM 9112 / NBRC 15066 / NRRL 15764) TaxID=1179773 RepID=K0JV29_SACES|nr:helix-turn-helix transcriptional regulator [Saccharothrix espanaensis]CCH29372.1 Transcriptional regulator [Saccharothrix espanaensis DSM 44229]